MGKGEEMIVELIEDSEGLILPLGDELCDEMGWTVGDNIKWTPNGNGGFILSKVETEWVLVETVQTFKHEYLVEVPKGKAEYALDTVVCEDATEFSQEHIGEQIFSHRIITKAEGLALARKRHDYLSKWDDETFEKNFFTHWEPKDEE